MTSAIGKTLQNLKIKYKILLLFVLLFILMTDLGTLNVTSVYDIRNDTQRISDQLIPRLLETTTIKDNLNLSILAAYDYVQTGNEDSKALSKERLGEALLAEIQLFQLSTSEADFEFTTSFEYHINGINSAITDLISAYERGESNEQLSIQLSAVAESRDAFASFLSEEIELKIQEESQNERALTDEQVKRTIMNVIVVGIIAIVVLIWLYVFVHRSVTEPIEKLTDAAERIGKGEFQYVDIDSGDELGIFADTFNTMTQRIKATRESLEIELEKTKKLDQQKTEFLSIAAHQLRTPMSGIKWLVNMVMEGDLGPVSKEAVEQLGKGRENIDRMILLINSLLDVSQMETEKLTYTLAPENIVELTKIITEELEHLMQENSVKVQIKKPPASFPLVAIDKDKMHMAIRNLVDNAIRYSRKDTSIKIDFGVEQNVVVMHITDTGYGIPQDEQERIFSKFYRGSNIQTIQADGSGLGLFIVNEIIHKHDGDVTFTSEEGKGTTFTVEIPIADEKFIAAYTAEQKEVEEATANGTAKKTSILKPAHLV